MKASESDYICNAEIMSLIPALYEAIKEDNRLIDELLMLDNMIKEV